MQDYPNILTIAGSDSGGGAGIQADLKTMTVLRGFGLSVITALTAQNGAGVTGIHASPPDFVALQMQTVLDGFNIAAAKTGMLCNSAVMLALEPFFVRRTYKLVVDPVCVSQSGHKLIEDDAIETLRKAVLPHADLLTPNLPEAEVLSGMQIKSVADVQAAMHKLIAMGAGAVLLKGGHFETGCAGVDEHSLTDWLLIKGEELKALKHRRVATNNNHGTGCTISAAIATFLGRGLGMVEAVQAAQEFLLRALEHSFTPGIGAGPVNFLAGSTVLEDLQ